MNIQTRAKYKKALRAANISTRGLSDADLEREYTALGGGQQEAQPAPAPELPEIEEQPEPVETKAEILPINGNAAEQLASLLAQLGGNSGISETRVKQLIEQHASTPRAIEVTVKQAPKTDAVKIERAHKELNTALTMASAGVHCYLVGPAGTGKTTLAMQVAESMGLEFYFTGAVLQKYELMGFVDAAGEYQSTPFYQWVKNGGLFLFDEIDASQPGALVAFNAALANGVVSFPNGETLKLHESCVCFAAANTYGKGATRQYVGRNPIDAATLDRFCMLELDYDTVLEQELTLAKYKELGGTDLDNANMIFSTILNLREKATHKSINAVISTRPMLKMAALMARGMASSKALDLALINGLSEDQRKALGV